MAFARLARDRSPRTVRLSHYRPRFTAPALHTTVPGGNTAFFGTTSTPSRMITSPFA